MTAKKEAEAKGYIFAINREEIVTKARKEGKLRVLSRLETEDLKPMAEAFKKKYPFIGVRRPVNLSCLHKRPHGNRFKTVRLDLPSSTRQIELRAR